MFVYTRILSMLQCDLTERNTGIWKLLVHLVFVFKFFGSFLKHQFNIKATVKEMVKSSSYLSY